MFVILPLWHACAAAQVAWFGAGVEIFLREGFRESRGEVILSDVASRPRLAERSPSEPQLFVWVHVGSGEVACHPEHERRISRAQELPLLKRPLSSLGKERASRVGLKVGSVTGSLGARPKSGEGFRMAVSCPECGRQYDVTLFQFGRSLTCECGYLIRAPGAHISRAREAWEGEGPPVRTLRSAAARRRMRELGRMADRVCSLIVATDYPEVDIEIEKAKVREKCEELFPERMELYEMVYESRFRRLWEQFRME